MKADGFASVFILACTLALTIPVTGSPSPNENANNTSASFDDAYSGHILGLDVTSFPTIKASVFIATPCARSGGLKKSDFGVSEDNSSVPIADFHFIGDASGHSIDLAVVFDDSQSMGDQINALKAEVQNLTDKIRLSNLDARYSLVTFKNDVSGNSINWTSDPAYFKSAIDGLQASGGSDVSPENSIEGIETALSFKFRPSAQKVIIVVTDEPSYQKGDNGYHSIHTLANVADDLINEGVILIAVSPDFRNPSIDPGIPRDDLPRYADMRKLASQIGGIWIGIDSADFSTILDEIQGMIIGTYIIEYKSLVNTGKSNRTVSVDIISSCDSTKGKVYGHYKVPSSIDDQESSNKEPSPISNMLIIRPVGIEYISRPDLLPGSNLALNSSDWINNGNSLYSKRDYAGAIKCYDKALNIDPQSALAWRNKGYTLYSLNNFSEAIDCYNKSIEIDAMDKIAWNDRGFVLLRMNMYEDALASFDEAISLDQNYPYAWVNKGTVLEYLKRRDEALKCFDKVLEIDPRFLGAWTNKGFTLFNIGRYNESLQCYEMAIQTDPSTASSDWNNKGNILIEFGDYKGAIQCFDEALKTVSHSPATWNNKGVALQDIGDYEEALRCYDKAIELSPQMVTAWHNKWLVLKALHRDSEAEAIRDKAGIKS